MELDMIIIMILGTIFVISVIARFLEQLDYNRVNAIILAIILYIIMIVFVILSVIYPIIYFIIILLCIIIMVKM